jgi:hypothetical protein
MDDYTKIQIEYFQESLDYLEKCTKTLYQGKGINLNSKRFFVRPKLNPQLYLDNNRQIKKELRSLDKIFLMPELGQFFETNVRSTVHIDEFINYAEDSRKWIARQIEELSFPKVNNQTEGIVEKLEQSSVIKQRFSNGELKNLCAKAARKIRLVKGEKLTGDKIEKVCKEIENMIGKPVNKSSVASELRDKLGYKNRIY